MNRYLCWRCAFEGPDLTIEEADDLRSAVDKFFPEYEESDLSYETVDGIECIRFFDDTIVGWNTDVEKDQTVSYLLEMYEDDIENIPKWTPPEVVELLKKKHAGR